VSLQLALHEVLNICQAESKTQDSG